MTRQQTENPNVTFLLSFSYSYLTVNRAGWKISNACGFCVFCVCRFPTWHICWYHKRIFRHFHFLSVNFKQLRQWYWLFDQLCVWLYHITLPAFFCEFTFHKNPILPHSLWSAGSEEKIEKTYIFFTPATTCWKFEHFFLLQIKHFLSEKQLISNMNHACTIV